MSQPNYSIVTESPGLGATPEQLSALYTRYRFASRFVQGRDVLEVACGVGTGLGYLAKYANRVVGGDIEQQNLRIARETYSATDGVHVQFLDAERLPFADESFDVMLLFEAIYYLKRPDRFLKEARRVLRPGGKLLITTVQPSWNGFNPSPYSIRYFSAGELYDLISEEGFAASLFAAFPAHPSTKLGRMVNWVRRLAVRLKLIPRTMYGKEWLKRLFYGELTPLPRVVKDDMADEAELVTLSSEDSARQYKFLYVLAESPHNRAA